MNFENWLTDPSAPLPDDIQALIFDCDGTLIDTMPIHYQAWCQMLGEYGLVMSEKLFYSYAGWPTVKMIEVLAKDQGITCNPEELAHRKELLYIERMAAAEPIHSVVAIAQREKGKRKLAVASGGWHNLVRQSLKNAGIEELFDTVVGADDVAHGKPAPDVFLKAARQLGVSPEHCVVYEDGEPGFAAARAAGMRLVDVRPWYLPRKAG